VVLGQAVLGQKAAQHRRFRPVRSVRQEPHRCEQAVLGQAVPGQEAAQHRRFRPVRSVRQEPHRREQAVLGLLSTQRRLFQGGATWQTTNSEQPPARAGGGLPFWDKGNIRGKDKV